MLWAELKSQRGGEAFGWKNKLSPVQLAVHVKKKKEKPPKEICPYLCQFSHPECVLYAHKGPLNSFHGVDSGLPQNLKAPSQEALLDRLWRKILLMCQSYTQTMVPNKAPSAFPKFPIVKKVPSHWLDFCIISKTFCSHESVGMYWGQFIFKNNFFYGLCFWASFY